MGKAAVERLVQQGVKVVLCDLPASKASEVTKNLGEDNVLFVPVDVTSEEDVQNAISLTKEKFGKLNYVINCAGIGVAYKTYNFNKWYPHQLEDFKKVLMVYNNPNNLKN